MAKVKITGGGLPDNAILENAATEQTLQELLAVMKGQKLNNTRNNTRPKDVLAGFAKSADEASESATEFSDTLDDLNVSAIKNTKSMKALDVVSKGTASTLNVFNRGLNGLTSGNADAAGQLAAFGEVTGGVLDGIGEGAMAAGSGLSFLGKKGKFVGGILMAAGAGLELFGEVATASMAALSTVIGIVDGFKQTFDAINASSFILDSSFGDLTDRAHAADLTLGDFARMVERNRNDLAFFGGSVNQGAKRVLALRTAMDQSVVDGFMNLGIGLENIPDAISNYLAIQGRSGRMMKQSDQEAIAGATALVKQQRLLANLTGKSVEALQAESMERTRATRIQASFNEMGPEAREAFNAAAGIAGTLGPTLQTGFEAIFAGDATDPIAIAMQSATPGLYAAFEDVRDGIANGSIGMEEAQQKMFSVIQDAGPGLKDDLDRLAESLRFSGIENPLSVLGTDLGLALERIPQLMTMTFDEYQAMIEKQYAGVTPTGVEDKMLTSFRNIEEGTKDVKLALQGIAADITDSIGKGATSVFSIFADNLRLASDALLTAAGGLKTPEAAEAAAEAAIAAYDPVTFWSVLGEGFKSGGSGALLGGAYGGGTGALAGGVGAVPGALGGAVVGGIGGFFAGMGGELLRLFYDESAAYNAEAEAARAVAEEKRDAESLEIYKQLYPHLAPHLAEGGIASGPSSGYPAMLHGTEAVVPLPNGRSIPIDMSNFASMLESALAPSGDPAKVANAVDELASTFSLDSSKIIDGSRTMPELLQINKALLQQYFALNEKFDRMVKAMEDGNNINRSSAFARA